MSSKESDLLFDIWWNEWPWKMPRDPQDMEQMAKIIFDAGFNLGQQNTPEDLESLFSLPFDEDEWEL